MQPHILGRARLLCSRNRARYLPTCDHSQPIARVERKLNRTRVSWEWSAGRQAQVLPRLFHTVFYAHRRRGLATREQKAFGDIPGSQGFREGRPPIAFGRRHQAQRNRRCCRYFARAGQLCQVFRTRGEQADPRSSNMQYPCWTAYRGCQCGCRSSS